MISPDRGGQPRDHGWLDSYISDELPYVDASRVEPGGAVYLVGAGPGDPGLLTVRGRELLDSCHAIVYDALAHPDLLERSDANAASHPGRAELHFVGKRGGDAGSAAQDEINELLVKLAREGKQVVRLKGGDPLIFGRGSEEAQALAEAGVRFEIVPGVTAGVAAPAYAGIPVTHRGLATSVTFVTGHEDPDKPETQTNWAALAQSGGTLVLYMGVKRMQQISNALIQGGLPAEIPAAAVQWGTHGRQRTIVATLATIAAEMHDARMDAPVITIIGWSVLLRDEIAWFDRRPLFGRRILVTRPARGSELASELRRLGADVLSAPATRIEPLDGEPLREALAELDSYDWVLFTSGNAVRIFWNELRAAGRDTRALASCRVAAVGKSTAEALLARGISVDVVPERFVAEGLLDSLRERGDVGGSRVLYATAEGARDVLPDGLEELGAFVDVIALYRSVPDVGAAAPIREALAAGEIELVTFTSASTVHGFFAAVGAEAARQVAAVSIGPITTSAARKAGVRVVAEAAEASVAGVVDAVLAHYADTK